MKEISVKLDSNNDKVKNDSECNVFGKEINNNININFNINTNIVRLRPELDRFISLFNGEKQKNIKKNNGRENMQEFNKVDNNIIDFSYLIKNNVFKDIYSNKIKTKSVNLFISEEDYKNFSKNDEDFKQSNKENCNNVNNITKTVSKINLTKNKSCIKDSENPFKKVLERIEENRMKTIIKSNISNENNNNNPFTKKEEHLKINEDKIFDEKEENIKIAKNLLFFESLIEEQEKHNMKERKKVEDEYKELLDYDKNLTQIINQKENESTKIEIEEKIEIQKIQQTLEALAEKMKLQIKRNKELDNEFQNKKIKLNEINKIKKKFEDELYIYEEDLNKEILLRDNALKTKSEFSDILRRDTERLLDLQKVNSNYIDYLKNIHNELLENKGNIRVFCRVRPILDKEMEKLKDTLSQNNSNNNGGSLKSKTLSSKSLNSGNNNLDLTMDHQENYLEYLGTDVIILNGPSVKSNIGLNKETQKKNKYYFDRVFNPKTPQNVIFDEISQLVQSALDGFKVCIFAYGQTGSGKTYTMEGDKNNPGVIPRSIEKIFNVKTYLERLGWKFTISLCYFEIYLDQIKDLLSKSNKEKEYFSVKNLKDITTIIVNSIDEINPYLEFASNKRTKAKTMCNEVSSRSHSICQLKIQGFNSENNQSRDGALNLIDLAGSERPSQSKVEGDKLKEAIAINESLFCLQRVIKSLNTANMNTINNSLNGVNINTQKDLKDKKQYVNYRESTLTEVLQDYLGGESKTLMFANISPLITQINETNNSLKFATEVNACVIK